MVNVMLVCGKIIKYIIYFLYYETKSDKVMVYVIILMEINTKEDMQAIDAEIL